MAYKFKVGVRLVVARPERDMARYKGRCAKLIIIERHTEYPYVLAGISPSFSTAELDPAPKKLKKKKGK